MDAGAGTLIDRAVALRDELRAAQEDTEARGHYGPEVHRAFLDAGLYRVLQPRRYGGYELDLPAFTAVVSAVARGCPSTGWCFSLASGHVLPVASHFPASAQESVLGGGDFRAPHRAGPGGTATPVEGGYVVTGRWDYSSGVPYATHFLGTALAPDGEGPPRPVVVIVPREDFTVLDDWGGDATLGMRGSGSNTVEITEAFVPEHLAQPYDWFLRDVSGGTSGTELHGNPMYLGRITHFYHSEIVAVIVGAAQAALDEYERLLREKKTLVPPQVSRFEHFDFQRDYGLAVGLVDSAEALLQRAGEGYMERCRRWAEAGEPFRPEDDMRLYGITVNAGRMAAEAVELLFRSAQSSAARRGSRLQRYYRDVSMYRGHNSAQHANSATVFARLHFGLPVRAHFQAPG
jgi:3-hydroxy-9,10-secoandrosta-1,3,5(10)-triene-9,17-dione monooxygenase